MTKHELIFEDIYDLIKGGDFEDESKKGIRKFIKYKHMEWNNDNHTITIGKHFIIKLINKNETKQKN